MDIRKALFISKVALAVVLGYLVVRTFVPENKEKSSKPASAMGGSPARVKQTTGSPDLSPKDYAEIIDGNPFDSSDQTAGSGNWTSKAYQHSVSEELGLALSGTISGSPVVARAIIKDLKTGALDLYKVDQIVAGARIESIEKDTVVLVCEGQRKVLKLNITHSGDNNDRQLPSPRTPGEIRKVAKTDLPAKTPRTNVQTRTGYVEAVLKNAIIKPYITNGLVEGLQITGLENLSIAKGIGLKNRDVIRSVNGHRLTNKQKAYQVFKKATSQTAIDIELMRDNKTKKLSFTM
ncbi:MAG: hypothetical protein FVQ85_14850 [Planctomycetes bacterium]|nr:hypothetical protein [Planctomycetota bacterium]